MNNHLIKWLFILLIILIFFYAFSSSYQSRAIDNLSYVIAMGIDLAVDKENLEITFEFSDVSIYSKEGSSTSSPILETVTANSIDNAINMLNVYTAKQVNLSHCKIVVLSQEIASKGIFSEFSELINNPEFRPSTNIIISKEKASNYLKNSSSSLDKILTKYFDIFPSSSKYTGYISNITIGEFYNNISNNISGNLAILGGVNNNKVQNISPEKITAGNSSIKGDRGTENIGLAVFNKDKFIGELTAQETLYHSILSNEVNNFIITIDAPNSIKSKLDISAVQYNPPKIKIDISNDTPTINIDLNLTGKVTTIEKNLDYTNEDVLNSISNSASIYLKTNIEKYLNKTSKSFGCDIDNFYRYAKSNFLTINKWESYNWYLKYPQAKFNVNANCNVVSGFVVSEK